MYNTKSGHTMEDEPLIEKPTYNDDRWTERKVILVSSENPSKFVNAKWIFSKLVPY